MKPDAEISRLWQLGHLKFHFGEKLAVKMLSPTTEVEYGAAPVEVVALSNDSPEESKKEPASLGMPDLKTGIA